MPEEPAAIPSYERAVLYTCEDFEVVQCRWGAGSLSPLHGHQSSRCVLFIKQGTFDNRTEFGFKTELTKLEGGNSLTIPPGARHEIRCTSPSGETIHIYMPRIAAAMPAHFASTSSSSEVRSSVSIGLESEGTSIKELEQVLEKVRTRSVTTSSPYFMNQLFAGFLPQTVIAQDLVMQTRSTLATSIGSPVFTEVEKEVVKQLGSLIGWKGGDGITVPGGSAGNFLALHCARHRNSPASKERGLDHGRYKIYVSEDAHYSFAKAAVVLGFGQAALERIASDDSGRMCASTLTTKIEEHLESGYVPLIVVGTAGTTVRGAFDSILELADIAEKYKIWLHVDAAWGGPALFSSTARHLVNGIDYADSVTFDAHKFFGSQLTSSFFLTKHEKILLEANDVVGGDYLFHEEEVVDRGRLSWQCGRGADAVSFWTLWKHLGTKQMGLCVDSFFELKNKLLAWIALQPRLRVLYDPIFLNICVEIIPPNGCSNDGSWSKYVRSQLIQNNQAMVNFSTDKQGLTFLRLILVHPFLELQHVTEILTWALRVE